MISYVPAIAISLAMHGVLIAVLAFGWDFFPREQVVNRPNFVKATLVAVESASKPKVTEQPKKEAPPKAAPKKVDLTKQRQEQERLKKLAADKKRKDELAKQKAQEAAKQKAEKERQARIARERAEKEAKLAAEKAAQEKAAKEKAEQERIAREAEARRLAEEKRLREEAERERQRIQREQQALLNDLAKERAQLDADLAAERAARQAVEDEVATKSYAALIEERVTSVWSRPASARNGMVVEVTIELIPTGEVINVNVTGSSGDAAFDRSAERAVRRVGEFSEIRDMPRRVFDKDFRSITLQFSPEDLRQ